MGRSKDTDLLILPIRTKDIDFPLINFLTKHEKARNYAVKVIPFFVNIYLILSIDQGWQTRACGANLAH